jgi:hypothetical protein
VVSDQQEKTKQIDGLSQRETKFVSLLCRDIADFKDLTNFKAIDRQTVGHSSALLHDSRPISSTSLA